jgi:N-acetylglucosamine-6-phosphate deacetylase
MDAALRQTVHAGVSLVDAARMAATTPARAIGLTGTGEIRPGLRADLVVLDGELRVERIIRGGSPVAPHRPRGTGLPAR